jgi:N-acetylmuramoyl-L-alanine amidase
VNRNSTFFISFFLSLSVLAAPQTFRIVIDPGHGGQDLGAVRDSFVESQITLVMAKKLKEQLVLIKLTDTFLTRDQDTNVSLSDRVKQAEAFQADLFVSLHANTSNSKYWTGMEFYFNTAKPVATQKTADSENVTNNQVIAQIKEDFKNYSKSEESLLLTKTIQNETTASTAEKGIIKQAPFFVIENTQMPSVLIELGFLSNRREAKKLTNPEYQDEIAKRLAQAILQYKEKSDKLRRLEEK